MSGYSYEEMQNMQRRAMERVQIMRQKSENALVDARKELDNKSPENLQQQEYKVRPKITNMPANFPAQKQYPTFKEHFEQENTKGQNEKVQQKPLVSNIIDNILNEPDRAILLGLIMLLKSEGADEALIMALMYIMN